MTALRRRLLRLETVGGRHVSTRLSDDELGRRLRAELADWLGADPAPLPADLRAEMDAFLAAPAETPA